jgi:hypothetical protein
LVRFADLIEIVAAGFLACQFNEPPVRCATGGCPQWPASPANATTSTTVTAFAIDKVYLGEAERTQAKSSTLAWTSFGFDLDGKITDRFSTDVCTRPFDSPSSVQVDPVRQCTLADGGCSSSGIDNSFGANILPILQSAGAVPAPSKDVTEAIDKGIYSLQLVVTGLDGTPNQTASGLGLQAFPAAQFDYASGDWPVLSTGLADPKDLEAGAKERFSSGWISNGTFVSGFGSLTLGIPFSGAIIMIPLHRAIVVMDVSPGAFGVTNGTIAGVMIAEELVAAMQRVAGGISTSLCGSAFDGIAQQIRQCADIRSDGSNERGPPCDGISFAIGFEGKLINPPTRIAVPPANNDPCDAGNQ